jgi:hypothetical protein
MLRDERSAFLVHKRSVIVLIIRVKAFQFEFLRISNAAVGTGITIDVAVHTRRFRIGFGVLAPGAYSVQVDEHVDDYTQFSLDKPEDDDETYKGTRGMQCCTESARTRRG